jgi:hypothetical protein
MLVRTRGWWLLIVSISVAHATEMLHPSSSQKQRFNVQRTSVSLGLEHVNDLECQGILIVHRLLALQEDVMVGLIMPELRPRNECWGGLPLKCKGGLPEGLGSPRQGGPSGWNYGA